jgi:hypothetical protein
MTRSKYNAKRCEPTTCSGVEIVVPFDCNRLSPNHRNHWATKAAHVKAARLSAGVAWLRAGSPRFDAPVVCQITIRRARKIDPDNALASCKALIDGIFGGNLTPDDSAQWVEFLPVVIESGAKYKNCPCVTFNVTRKAQA